MTKAGWITVITMVAVLASHPAWAQSPVQPPLSDEIAKDHAEVRATLGPTLPKPIDATTALTGLRADGITLTYQFRIDVDKTQLAPEFDDALGKKAIATACGDTRSRGILAAGGRYRFEYTDKFDQMLLQVTVTRNDCV